MDNVFMSQDLYNWISSAPDNACFILIFAGFFTCMIYGLIFSFTNYLNDKAWRVYDYEKTLYYLYDNFFNKNMDVKSAIVNATHSSGSHSLEDAYISYSEKLERKNNYKKYFNKIKNFFKR